ncbi:MAG: hypothetical protein V1740_08075 [Candidatus Woesearchaeota archaeon]
MNHANPYRIPLRERPYSLKRITEPGNEVRLIRAREKPKIFKIIDGTAYNWLRHQFVPIRNGEIRIQGFSLEGYKRIGFMEYDSALVLGKKIIKPPHYAISEFFFMGDANHFVYAGMAHFDKRTGYANIDMCDIELFLRMRGNVLNAYFKSDDLEEKVRRVLNSD